MPTQKCILCGETKDLDEYYAHPQMANKHLGICKVCVKKRAKIHAGTSAGKEVERKRNQKPERKANLQIISRNWLKANPERGRTHSAVARALKKGILIKPTKCQDCQEEAPLHAHHDDYSKPLEVKWLCVPCHGKRHPKYKEL